MEDAVTPYLCKTARPASSNMACLEAFVTACVAAMVLAPSLSRAECSTDASHFKLPYSDKAIAARNQFYTSMCGGDKGEVFDFSDPSLKGRIELPSKLVAAHTGNYYPDSARRKHHEGKTITAYVVETNGDVVEVSVIESSGYDELDQAAISAVKGLHFERPAKLDGHAVRVILYIPIDWKLAKPTAMNLLFQGNPPLSEARIGKSAARAGSSTVT